MSRHRPKERLNTRINPVLSEWLETVARREGWTLTEAVEWALSGVRHLEHRLGTRLANFLDDQRSGGEGLFVTIGRRLDLSFANDPPTNDVAPIVPPHRKARVRKR